MDKSNKSDKANEADDRIDHVSNASDGVAKTEKVVNRPNKKSSVGKKVSAAILFLVISLIVGFAGGVLAVNLSEDTGQNSVLNNISDNDGAAVTTDEEAIASVAKKVSPSVVSIVSTSTGGPFQASSDSAGTGIILSKDGYVMTNLHVVKDAQNVSVILASGKEYKDVRVLGHDPLNDVAFLKISGVSDLTPAQLGDSGTVRIGQQVVAIGNALGQFQTTVTSGIISAKGRPITASTLDGSSPEQLTDLLQTDAAINSGNSGGPLVDLSGKVIGINTAVATDANNIGFAIPINATKGLIKGVLKDGKVEKAYLGVRYIDITPEVASSEGLSVTSGAYVSTFGNGAPVAKGGPADKAGLKAGDIITKVDGTEIGSSGSLASIVGQYQPDDTIKLTVLRDEETKTLEVKLDDYRNR